MGTNLRNCWLKVPQETRILRKYAQVTNIVRIRVGNKTRCRMIVCIGVSQGGVKWWAPWMWQWTLRFPENRVMSWSDEGPSAFQKNALQGGLSYSFSFVSYVILVNLVWPESWFLIKIPPPGAERKVMLFLGAMKFERTALFCSEYCVIEFGAGDVWCTSC